MNKEDINIRFVEAVNHLLNSHIASSKADLATTFGIKPSKFSEILNYRMNIGTDLAAILCSSYNINSNWLLTGEGSMLRREQKKAEMPETPSINQDYSGAPYYNVDFIGGFDLMINDQTINPDYYINYRPFNKEGILWCNLTGHSMEPELLSGDIIALKELNTPIQYLPAGEIYGIVTEEFRTVKRIRLSQREGYVRLIPSNKSEEYAEQEIPIAMILKVYAVLGSIRKFF